MIEGKFSPKLLRRKRQGKWKIGRESSTECDSISDFFFQFLSLEYLVERPSTSDETRQLIYNIIQLVKFSLIHLSHLCSCLSQSQLFFYHSFLCNFKANSMQLGDKVDLRSLWEADELRCWRPTRRAVTRNRRRITSISTAEEERGEN